MLGEIRELSALERTVAQLLDLEKHVAWEDGYELDQVRFYKSADGWRMMVKAVGKRKAHVAFLAGDTYPDCLQLAGEWGWRGLFVWKEDDWPSENAKRLLREAS